MKRNSIDVSRETQARLEAFVSLLLRWNRTVNLISRADELRIWDRHVADSLQLRQLLKPHTDRAIDLGSGGGFPGLVLALATGIQFDLIESDRRKAAFLREAIRETGAPAKVHAVRIEAAKVQPAPLVTARALAPLHRLLQLASPLVAPGGICLFLKGEEADAELTQAATQWHMDVTSFPSRVVPRGHILRIDKLIRVAANS